MSDTETYLSVHLPTWSRDKVRVLLVAVAIGGPTPSGGIAAAFRHLLDHLKHDPRMEVTVLYTGHPYYSRGNESTWQEAFSRDGVSFHGLPKFVLDRQMPGPRNAVAAYRAFLWMLERDGSFDVVHFHDYMGNGYFATLAKHQGLAFHDTRLVMQLHSTMQWADEGNYRVPESPTQLMNYYMEQVSVELADVRISPSAAYIRWLTDVARFNLTRGVNLVIQNTMYPLPEPTPSTPLAASKPMVAKHLVFFGRLEVRKGLLVFIEAIRKLVALGGPLPESVAFVGMQTTIGKGSATSLIEKHTGSWPFSVLVRTNWTSAESSEFLMRPGAVAVMPVYVENSPYAVLELVAQGIRFITTRDEGSMELLDAESLADCNCVTAIGDAGALADTFQRALTVGVRQVRAQVPLDVTVRHHKEATLAIAADASFAKERRPAAHRRITVAITRSEEAVQLEGVRAVLAQNYSMPLVDIVMIEDDVAPGSKDALAAEVKAAGAMLKVLPRPAASSPGAIRNTLLQGGKGEFVCFIKDTDKPLPHMLDTIMRVASETGARLLTSFADHFGEDSAELAYRHVSPGSALAANFYEDFVGGAALCVHREEALSLGPFDGAGDARHLNRSMFVRAGLAGLRTEIIPLVLVHSRVASERAASQKDVYGAHVELVDLVAGIAPAIFRDVVDYCHAQLASPRLPNAPMWIP